MPVVAIFGEASGANIVAVASVFNLLNHYSIILPSASVFAALLWSNGKWISQKDVLKHGIILVILATIAAIALVMPISLLLFR